MKPIKIGLVGVGMIARSQHIPALRENPAFKLEACASRNGRVEGIDNFPSLESMLDAHPGLDAITICTPPQAHYDAARTVRPSSCMRATLTAAACRECQL